MSLDGITIASIPHKPVKAVWFIFWVAAAAAMVFDAVQGSQIVRVLHTSWFFAITGFIVAGVSTVAMIAFVACVDRSSVTMLGVPEFRDTTAKMVDLPIGPGIGILGAVVDGYYGTAAVCMLFMAAWFAAMVRVHCLIKVVGNIGGGSYR